MTTKSTIEAGLKLAGRFQIEELTRIIQLEPTETWRAGEPVQSTKLKREKDGWVFSLPRREAHDIGSVLTELLAALEGRTDKVVLAVQRLHLEAVASLGVYIRGEAPAC